jgi:GTP-binding protein HflX
MADRHSDPNAQPTTKRKKREFAGFSEEDLNRPPERTIVLVPVLNGPHADTRKQGQQVVRSVDARLEEAKGLARAINLEIVEAGIVQVKTPKPGTLFGTGKIEELAMMAKANDAGLVFIDHALTPVQQRNLEKELGAKVLDRTGLILEIFGERAQTREGRLQVELAHLKYQRSRLVRSWTHLERQRGGAGFMGGPGETQIEADRRMIQTRVTGLEKELEKVRRTRTLHRARRQRVPHPVVAFVGYTNAGKSTLFNTITKAGVTAQDMLFATLDPTMRRLDLPKGTRVILSDTVGFVSDLPTTLVAAFRATLEEVIEAELILHVRDVSHEDFSAQGQDVEDVLRQLGVDPGGKNVLEIWNKIDQLTPDDREALERREDGQGRQPSLVSALDGAGVSELLRRIEDNVSGASKLAKITLTPERMGLSAWLYEKGIVTEREEHEDGNVSFEVRLSHSDHAAFMAKMKD